MKKHLEEWRKLWIIILLALATWLLSGAAYNYFQGDSLRSMMPE